MICKICGKDFDESGISYHISQGHKISLQEYYDSVLKHKNEGKCKKCGKPTNFISLTKGYKDLCDDCLPQTKEIICKICGYKTNAWGIGNHCQYSHNISTKEYYDKFLKKSGEGICKICGKPTSYTIITKGYEICCSKECLDQYHKTKEYKESLLNNTKNYKTKSSYKTIGEGKESVYLYYYQIYLDRAIQNNNKYFECKIGMTSGDPEARVLDQCQTSLPEYPVIALIIKCDDSKKLEYLIHTLLDARNKRLNNSPGKEWFLTNPDEVEQLYYMICGG